MDARVWTRGCQPVWEQSRVTSQKDTHRRSSSPWNVESATTWAALRSDEKPRLDIGWGSGHQHACRALFELSLFRSLPPSFFHPSTINRAEIRVRGPRRTIRSWLLLFSCLLTSERNAFLRKLSVLRPRSGRLAVRAPPRPRAACSKCRSATTRYHSQETWLYRDDMHAIYNPGNKRWN